MGKSTHQLKGGSSYRGSNTPQTRVFEGSCVAMKGYYYTHHPDHQAVDEYQQTTEKLIEIVCSSCKESQLLKKCLKELTEQAIPEPTLGMNGPPDKEGNPTSTKQGELKYISQFKTYEARQLTLKESLNNTFSIIYGQCNRAMEAKISEAPDWEAMDTACNPIGLLRIIQGIAHNNETQHTTMKHKRTQQFL